MNDIETKNIQRRSYLKHLYELWQNDRYKLFHFVEVGKGIGLDESTSDEVSDYLRDEKLIDFTTLSGVSITHKGIKEIENFLSQSKQAITSKKVSILFLAADPSNETRLRLGEELREIQEKLQLAMQRERFDLQQRMSVRPADISQALLDVQPEIVHFSGHGAATGALCFENQIGEAQLVSPDALAALFEQFSKDVKCVILNACYSEIQAQAIAEHIENVIGMNTAIGDKAAIAFAVGFYQALGAGRSVEEAFKLGKVQIRLQGIPEHLTPILFKQK